MIGLDIEDPLLIDYIEDELKKIGHSYYSNQMLKNTADAYISLFNEYLESDIKDIIGLLKKG